MKFRLIVTLANLALFCAFFFARPAHADYPQALADYQHTFTAYREALSAYNVARSEYLTYKTLTARTQAIYATQQMLEHRHKVMVVYVTLLRERLKLAENAYIPADQYQIILTRMDNETSWLNEHGPLIANAEDLEDLMDLSAQADAHIDSINRIGYQAKSLVMANKVWEYIAVGNDVLSVTNEQVNRITKIGLRSEKITNLNRWLIDAREKMNLANNNMERAQTLANTAETPELYFEVQSELRKTIQYIENTNELLKEIIRSIKLE